MSDAMPDWGEAPLPFLAVGRVKDGVTLAYYITEAGEKQGAQTRDVFKKLLKASKEKLSPNEKTRLLWHSGTVCCLMDGQRELLYCVVTKDLNYPEKNAYKLLNDLVQHVQELGSNSAPFRSDLEAGGEYPLNRELRPVMQKLVEAYMYQNVASQSFQIESRGQARPSGEVCTKSRLLGLLGALLVALLVCMYMLYAQQAWPGRQPRQR